jgi:hypothetical protein
MAEIRLMSDEQRLDYLLSLPKEDIETLRCPPWVPAEVVWLLLEEIKKRKKEKLDAPRPA